MKNIGRLLPPQMIIKNFIYGNPECNYENYLLELINHSLFFMEKSKGIPYEAPLREDHGENDCITPHFEMDFKLAESETRLKAHSIYANRLIENDDNSLIVAAPREYNEENRLDGYETATLKEALEQYSYNQLEWMCEHRDSNKGINPDVVLFLTKIMTKYKNLLLFYPYEYKTRKETCTADDIKDITDDIECAFAKAFRYRENHVSGFETYYSFIFGKFMPILKYDNGTFELVDVVNTDKSPIYKQLKYIKPQ